MTKKEQDVIRAIEHNFGINGKAVRESLVKAKKTIESALKELRKGRPLITTANDRPCRRADAEETAPDEGCGEEGREEACQGGASRREAYAPRNDRRGVRQLGGEGLERRVERKAVICRKARS